MRRKESAVTDEAIIAVLLASGTLAEAAAKLNLSSRTIYDRMRTKDFKVKYAAAKSDIVRGAVFNINSKLTQAIETVSELMEDKDVNPAVRLQAAQTILGNAQKFSERLQEDEYRIESSARSFFDDDPPNDSE